MKEVVQFIYNGSEVAFVPNGNDNLMVNATHMAKIFGKQVESFTRNEITQKFILECLKKENSRFLNIENESDLLDAKQNSGTWMHRVLALKFAAWLDPAFELWVYITIDKILLGHYQEMKEATIEKLHAEQELAIKKEALIKNHPELAEIFELELKITAADRKKTKAIKAAVAQFKLDLYPEAAS